MSSRLDRKDILIIGDKIVATIGAATGIEACIVDPNECELPDKIKRDITKYGVIIILENIIDKCRNIKDLMYKYFDEILIVVIPPPERISEADLKKRYGEFIRKIVGLKISF